MAANRKLQGEIDRTLKKVQEGVELFDEIWEKVYNAQNQNQKEKFESELKSQIKKLQRYRDDIKTWITNSDIKDKRPLTDARKLIETEMERFKVCEKEFKTKAFSKEGLSQAAKEDPKEKERNRVRKWIGAALEIITDSKDKYEAELETINSSKKKKKDSGAAKWEELIERCGYHEGRLELVLRLIDNETFTPEDVDQIKDQLDYLLECMSEGNVDELEGVDDESIYEELGLDDQDHAEEAAAPVVETKTPDKRKSKAEKDEEERREKEKKKEKEKVATVTELPSINAAALKAKPLPKSEPAKTAAAKEVPPVTGAPKLGMPSGGSAASPSLPPGTTAAQAARGKAAAVPLTAAAAAVRGRGDASAPGQLPGQLPGMQRPTAAEAARSGRKEADSPAGLPGFGAGKSAGASGAPGSFGAAATAGLPAPGGRGGAMGGLPGVGIGGVEPGGVSGGLPTPGSRSCDSSGPLAGLGGSCGADDAHAPISGIGAAGGIGARAAAPAAVSDGAIAEEFDRFEELLALGSTPTGGGGQLDDAAATRQLLSLSLFNMPESGDSEKPRTYVPRNPYPTPNSFPQTPAPVFDTPSTFDKFDTDTLFFIFYYQQGTYQQYLAARELKKQSWRYHKKYLTWFQRHEEPKVTADDYEQGTYVYFDYETGWCQRIKSDFQFDYAFLEDELQV
jgi:CCR4-NOT transcription complex subunit 3